MFRDEQGLPIGGDLRCEVAIVGGGMAGILLADRLRAGGRCVCLLESGGRDPEPSAQRLSRGENVGRAYFDLARCRFRVLGGSSIRWGGWCRPLDPIDFARRDWIPLSGWPIGPEDLAAHYAEAARVLGLPTASCALADWADRIPPPPTLPDEPLEAGVIQHGPQVDFGERWHARLRDDEDVTVLLHCTATELVLGRSGDRLDHIRVATLRGRRFRLRADRYVLAAGGIENARLLLASRGRGRVGVGNEHGLVGRCFMEHLHVATALVVPTGDEPLAPFFQHSISHDGPAHGILTPTATALGEWGMPSCSISLAPAGSAMGAIPRLNWPTVLMAASQTTARRLHRTLPRLDARARRAVLSAWRTRRTARVDHDTRRVQAASHAAGAAAALAYVRAEQVPNRDSRVTLGEARDALGVPRVRLDWQLTALDLAGVAHWTAQLGEVMRSAGLGTVIDLRDWERTIIGGPHHLGTTRMATDPREGVVDADCRVHGTKNLYVAGSSVFATGGHANPSLTVLALSLRLAEHLGAPSASRTPTTRSQLGSADVV